MSSLLTIMLSLSLSLSFQPRHRLRSQSLEILDDCDLFSDKDPFNRGIGWCADGFRYVDTYTLQPDELGDMYGLSLYTVAEPGNTRAQMNNTANRCIADPHCKAVMPTIVLGAG